MKMTKKAQTATEYLIILAVVIVIALVVASLLGEFPGLGGNIGSNSNKGYWVTTDIAVTKIRVSANEGGVLKLSNNFPETITITSVEMVDDDTATNVYGVASDGDKILSTGDDFTFTFPAGNMTSIDLSAGDTYSAYVRINYTDSIGATYSFIGSKPITTTVATS